MDLVLWLMLALSLDRSLGSWHGLCARNLHCIGGVQMLSHASEFLCRRMTGSCAA